MVADDTAQIESRLVRVVLVGESLTRLSALMEADRAQAVADLLAENHFAPVLPPQRQAAAEAGRYGLHLAIQDGRLAFDIRDAADAPLYGVILALHPFRTLIRDYHMLVESHVRAVQEGREARIQAIDMGRRGLHNEGAALLRERLAGKIAIDFATARRLFTLLCVLHHRIGDTH
jgi:uncharacterized protein (UPF0262 family)